MPVGSSDASNGHNTITVSQLIWVNVFNVQSPNLILNRPVSEGNRMEFGAFLLPTRPRSRYGRANFGILLVYGIYA